MKLKINRRTSKEILLKNLKIGGENKISIQTMLTSGLDEPGKVLKK